MNCLWTVYELFMNCLWTVYELVHWVHWVRWSTKLPTPGLLDLAEVTPMATCWTSGRNHHRLQISSNIFKYRLIHKAEDCQVLKCRFQSSGTFWLSRWSAVFHVENWLHYLQTQTSNSILYYIEKILRTVQVSEMAIKSSHSLSTDAQCNQCM